MIPEPAFPLRQARKAPRAKVGKKPKFINGVPVFGFSKNAAHLPATTKHGLIPGNVK
jgi:hypothetical protein